MSKQTAAVMKGTDPRPQPPLTTWDVTVNYTGKKTTFLENWTGLDFTADTSGMLTGNVTVNGIDYDIQGYISKNSKVKITFEDTSGTSYLIKGIFTPGTSTTAAEINNGSFKSASDLDDFTDDGAWSATAQTGPPVPPDK